MKRFVTMILFGLAACSAPEQRNTDAQTEMSELALDAPGFIDFIAIDDAFAWTTNRGKVEKWSQEGVVAATAVPGPCGTMAVLDDALWVANCEGENLYRIDTKTAEVSAVLETGIAEPRGETNVVAGAGSVWVPSSADGIISRIDPSTNEVIAKVEVVPGTFFLAFGFDHLWAVSSEQRLLQRIDPATNAVTGSVELGNQPGFLAAGEGAAWVQEQKDGTVAKILPDDLTIASRTKVGKTLLYGDIDTGGGKVWLRTTDDQIFVILDPETGKILGRYGDPAGSGAIRYTPEGVWTTAHDIERISWWTMSDRKAGSD